LDGNVFFAKIKPKRIFSCNETAGIVSHSKITKYLKVENHKRRLRRTFPNDTKQRRVLSASIVVVLVGVIGVQLLLSIHAATSVGSQEAESGTIGGNGCISTDSNASGGSFVKFGGTCTGTTTTYPSTPPAQICGNGSILGNGPASAPAGAVTVAAGDNSGINWQQAGKTFWFAPGTHTLGTDAFNQINPAANVTLTGAPGAIIDGQGKNHYAVVGTSTGVTITYLTFKNFGTGSSSTTPSSDDNNEGVINHDAGHNWTIQYITAQYNAGAAVFMGSGDTVSDNCLDHNGQYGFSVYENAGVSNVTLNHNEISWNDTYDWESHISECGCTGGGKFWATNGVTFTNNYVHDNYSVGVWADTDNTSFQFEGNYISNNHNEGLIYEISYNFLVKNNNFVHNAVAGGISDSGFPHSAVYISESGSDPRVPGLYGTESDITGNNFSNNWGGVILYENPNRYCSSTANTSSGYCTLVNPNVANINTCANANDLKSTPYIDDCRWKTKNVKIFGNTFSSTPSQVSPSCTVANKCGYNGLFSQYGVYAPYTGWVTPTNISNNQNNTFYNNTYTGTWNFDGYDLGETVTFPQWQAGFTDQDGSGVHFGAQDAGSTQH
jgi:hypothetical protein